MDSQTAMMNLGGVDLGGEVPLGKATGGSSIVSLVEGMEIEANGAPANDAGDGGGVDDGGEVEGEFETEEGGLSEVVVVGLYDGTIPFVGEDDVAEEGRGEEEGEEGVVEGEVVLGSGEEVLDVQVEEQVEVQGEELSAGGKNEGDGERAAGADHEEADSLGPVSSLEGERVTNTDVNDENREPELVERSSWEGAVATDGCNDAGEDCADGDEREGGEELEGAKELEGCKGEENGEENRDEEGVEGTLGSGGDGAGLAEGSGEEEVIGLDAVDNKFEALDGSVENSHGEAVEVAPTSVGEDRKSADPFPLQEMPNEQKDEHNGESGPSVAECTETNYHGEAPSLPHDNPTDMTPDQPSLHVDMVAGVHLNACCNPMEGADGQLSAPAEVATHDADVDKEADVIPDTVEHGLDSLPVACESTEMVRDAPLDDVLGGDGPSREALADLPTAGPTYESNKGGDADDGAAENMASQMLDESKAGVAAHSATDVTGAGTADVAADVTAAVAAAVAADVFGVNAAAGGIDMMTDRGSGSADGAEVAEHGEERSLAGNGVVLALAAPGVGFTGRGSGGGTAVRRSKFIVPGCMAEGLDSPGGKGKTKTKDGGGGKRATIVRNDGELVQGAEEDGDQLLDVAMSTGSQLMASPVCSALNSDRSGHIQDNGVSLDLLPAALAGCSENGLLSPVMGQKLQSRRKIQRTPLIADSVGKTGADATSSGGRGKRKTVAKKPKESTTDEIERKKKRELKRMNAKALTALRVHVRSEENVSEEGAMAGGGSLMSTAMADPGVDMSLMRDLQLAQTGGTATELRMNTFEKDNEDGEDEEMGEGGREEGAVMAAMAAVEAMEAKIRENEGSIEGIDGNQWGNVTDEREKGEPAGPSLLKEHDNERQEGRRLSGKRRGKKMVAVKDGRPGVKKVRRRNAGGVRLVLALPVTSPNASPLPEGRGKKRLSGTMSSPSMVSELIPVETAFLSTKLKAGDLVEVITSEPGLRWCWFSGMVLQVKETKVLVRYDELLDAAIENKKLEEWISLRGLPGVPAKCGNNKECARWPRIRPRVFDGRKQKGQGGDEDWVVGDRVEVYWNDGWWEGILKEVNERMMKVHFPGEDEMGEYPVEDVRKSYVFRDGLWVRWREAMGSPFSMKVESISGAEDQSRGSSRKRMKPTRREVVPPENMLALVAASIEHEEEQLRQKFSSGSLQSEGACGLDVEEDVVMIADEQGRVEKKAKFPVGAAAVTVVKRPKGRPRKHPYVSKAGLWASGAKRTVHRAYPSGDHVRNDGDDDVQGAGPAKKDAVGSAEEEGGGNTEKKKVRGSAKKDAVRSAGEAGGGNTEKKKVSGPANKDAVGSAEERGDGNTEKKNVVGDKDDGQASLPRRRGRPRKHPLGKITVSKLLSKNAAVSLAGKKAAKKAAAGKTKVVIGSPVTTPPGRSPRLAAMAVDSTQISERLDLMSVDVGSVPKSVSTRKVTFANVMGAKEEEVEGVATEVDHMTGTFSAGGRRGGTPKRKDPAFEYASSVKKPQKDKAASSVDRNKRVTTRRQSLVSEEVGEVADEAAKGAKVPAGIGGRAMSLSPSSDVISTELDIPPERAEIRQGRAQRGKSTLTKEQEHGVKDAPSATGVASSRKRGREAATAMAAVNVESAVVSPSGSKKGRRAKAGEKGVEVESRDDLCEAIVAEGNDKTEIQEQRRNSGGKVHQENAKSSGRKESRQPLTRSSRGRHDSGPKDRDAAKPEAADSPEKGMNGGGRSADGCKGMTKEVDIDLAGSSSSSSEGDVQEEEDTGARVMGPGRGKGSIGEENSSKAFGKQKKGKSVQKSKTNAVERREELAAQLLPKRKGRPPKKRGGKKTMVKENKDGLVLSSPASKGGAEEVPVEEPRRGSRGAVKWTSPPPAKVVEELVLGDDSDDDDDVQVISVKEAPLDSRAGKSKVASTDESTQMIAERPAARGRSRPRLSRVASVVENHVVEEHTASRQADRGGAKKQTRTSVKDVTTVDLCDDGDAREGDDGSKRRSSQKAEMKKNDAIKSANATRGAYKRGLMKCGDGGKKGHGVKSDETATGAVHDVEKESLKNVPRITRGGKSAPLAEATTEKARSSVERRRKAGGVERAAGEEPSGVGTRRTAAAVHAVVPVVIEKSLRNLRNRGKS